MYKRQLERKIQHARNDSQQKIARIEKEAEEVKLKLEELKLKQNRERLELHNNVIQLIEYVSNFKINIQGSIEDLRTSALGEIERLSAEL